MKFNIRNKLIIFATTIILLPLGLSALLILIQLSSFTNERSAERIKSDARVAQSIFAKRQENLRSAAQSIAQTLAGRGLASAPAAAAPAAGAAAQPAGPKPAGATPPSPASSKALQDLLKGALSASQVSFVVVLDPTGKVVAQHNGPPVGDGLYFKNNPLFVDVNNLAQKGQPEARSGAVTEEAAAVEALGLKDRVAASGVDKGLFLEAAAPVMSGETLSRVVLLGQLVNNDVSVESAGGQQSIVNEIKGTLYRDMRDQAAAVIALGDTIVTTNLGGGQKGGVAIGTKLTGSTGNFSFEQPSYNYQDFPDGSYITSFVPIEDVGAATGTHIIGRIGVAIREEWFTQIVRKIQWTILGVSLGALALTIGVAVYSAGRFTSPIVELTEAANRISLGELDVPIAVGAHDEIGTLAEALDRMRISLKQAIERLRKR